MGIPVLGSIILLAFVGIIRRKEMNPGLIRTSPVVSWFSSWTTSLSGRRL